MQTVQALTILAIEGAQVDSEVIADLKKEAKECETVYLSPDPDREGEAIAWHIASLLPPKTNILRVTFNAITKEADGTFQARAIPEDWNFSLWAAQSGLRVFATRCLNLQHHGRIGYATGVLERALLKISD